MAIDVEAIDTLAAAPWTVGTIAGLLVVRTTAFVAGFGVGFGVACGFGAGAAILTVPAPSVASPWLRDWVEIWMLKTPILSLPDQRNVTPLAQSPPGTRAIAWS